MRRILPALALLAGCASPGQPPGGPPDTEPPKLLGISPDTGSRNVRTDRITLRFDEVVNERSTPRAASPTTSGRGATPGNRGGMTGGAGGGMGGGFAGGGFGGGSMSGNSSLASMFVISPSDGRDRINWKREAIEVVPRGGFRAQTTYRVVLLPGMGDLRGNFAPEGLDLVFSTGPTLADGAISGALFDWPAGKVATNAPLEAYLPSDTLFRWRTRSDSTGRFSLAYLTPGTYHLRGWVDQNNNGVIDPREAVDTATVRVDSTATIDLYAFARDTIGPRIEQVEIVDSVAVRIRFDRPTAVDWTPTSASLRLLRTDSTEVPLGPLLAGEPLDTAIAQARAARAAFRDSVRKDSLARDTTARDTADVAGAPTDTVPRDTLTRPTDRAAVPAPGDRAPPEPLVPALADSLPVALADSLAADTLPSRPPPVLQRPIPAQTWGAILTEPLPPGLYRLKLTQVPGMSGTVRDSERELRLRPPAAPRDTTARGRSRLP
ncbi:MAG: hypothetical protein ACO3SD_03850 [Gemmatimonadaceae bacterium]